MKWRRTLQNLWPFGVRPSTGQATDAIRAAEQSQVQAFHDRAQAAATRAVAEELEAQIHRHNVANHFDDWLQKVIQGRD